MNGNIRVGNLFGIPFYVNISWFLVLGLVTWTYGEELAQLTQLKGSYPWILGFIAAVLLFASVLAHELGHSLVAIMQGINVKSITLFIFGGLAVLEKDAKTPLGAFFIAIAGPVVSLILFGLFTFISLIPLPAPIAEVVYLLAIINLVLALFNLIPGLPLDGGNILKALVWKITGNPNRGVIFASRIGQLFGCLSIALGILAVLGISPVGNFWTILIGWFLLQNAGLHAQSAKVQEKLDSFTAEDAVIADSPIVRADLSLREFANEYVIGKDKWSKFLVTNEIGQLIGAITVEDLKKIATSQWTEIPVSSLIKPLESIITVKSNVSLLEVVKLIEKQDVKTIAVVRENGVVVGLIEKASIISLLQKEVQTKPA
jgi:Zn-dependent protease/CBS domain-containing protein